MPGAEHEVAVSDVAQDARGWIWITTPDGLFRLDGERRIPWGPRIPGDPIEILAVDEDRVTVLVDSRQIYEVRADRLDELTGPDGGPLGKVRHAVVSDGALWAIRDRTLLWRRDGLWREKAFPDHALNLVRAAPSGAWLLATDAALRLDRDGEGIDRIDLPFVTDVDGHDEELWLATYEAGTWYRRGTELRPIAPAVLAMGRAEWGESVEADDNGAWVGTTGGILRFEHDRRVTFVAIPQGFPQHDGLLLDREGSLWVPTLAGIRFRPAAETRILETPQLPQRAIVNMAHVGDRLWATTWNVGGWYDREEVWHPVPYEGISGRFCEDAQGRRWDLAWNFTPLLIVRYWLDGGTEPIPLHPGESLGGCDASGLGGEWVGTDERLWYHDASGYRPIVAPVEGTSDLREDPRGVLHLLGGERECHAVAAEVLAGTAEWRCAAPWEVPPRAMGEVEGTLWAFGRGAGILVEQGDTWVPHAGSSGLTSPSISAVRPAREGLWVAGGDGLLRIRPTPPDTPWEVLERLDVPAGLPGTGAVDVVEEPDGTLWVGTSSGMVRLPPSSRVVTPIPAPEISALWVNGQAAPPGGALEVEWPHHQLELRAAVATFRDRAHLVWRARLRDDLVFADSDDAILRLVDLPPGTYAVTLEASADGGTTWSAPSEPIPLSVVLPWYLRPLAIAVYLTTALGALYAAHRLRLRAVVAVERERNRIALDLHDDLGAGISTVSMLTGLATQPDLSDEARREVAAEAESAARTLADSLGDVVWTLRRDAGRPDTLARSLVERARRLFADGEARLVLDLPPSWPDVSLPLRVYRNVQLVGYEALQNAARHAEARTVTLRFHPWTLEVVDDGRGRLAVSHRPGTGTGTEAMRARAAEIGATLEIRDREGGGTVVRLVFRA